MILEYTNLSVHDYYINKLVFSLKYLAVSDYW